MGLLTWFKAQMFGGKVLRTLGSVEGIGGSPGKIEMKVHSIAGKAPAGENKVGIEIVASSLVSYRMMPCTLTRAEAGKLVDLINQAIR